MAVADRAVVAVISHPIYLSYSRHTIGLVGGFNHETKKPDPDNPGYYPRYKANFYRSLPVSSPPDVHRPIIARTWIIVRATRVMAGS